MKNLGYLISLIGVWVIVHVSGLSFLDIIDPASFVIVVVPMIGSGIIVAGFRPTIRSIIYLFSENVAKEEADIQKKLFDVYGNIALGVGFLGMLIGFASMARNAGDADLHAWGRGIAACLISPVYGLGLKYLVFLPVSKRLEK